MHIQDTKIISTDIPEVDAQGKPLPPPRKWLEPLTPSECRGWEMPPGYQLVGDFHVTRGGITVIGGPPGLGKSRAALHLAMSGATGADWFGLPVHQKFKTFILQDENGRHRLKSDFGNVDPEMDEFIRVTPPPEHGMRFDNEGFKEALRGELEDFKPGVVVIDPFTNVARDSKQGDYSDAFIAIRECLPSGADEPAIIIVAHTRKPKVGERTNGTALLNELLGSIKLGAVARSAFVMQAATTDTTDNRVVWNCCKNNDGDKGPRTAWRREDGVFAYCQNFDWEEFDSGPEQKRRAVRKEHLDSIFGGGERRMTRAVAAKALMSEAVCDQSTAYDALKLLGEFKENLREVDGMLEWSSKGFSEPDSGRIYIGKKLINNSSIPNP